MRLRFLLPLLALMFVAFAKKQSQVTVHFHLEANAQDTSTFAIPATLHYPPRQAYVEKIPSFTERDIAAIYPFPADDGTMGCAFKFDEHGRFDLEMLSTEHRGHSLVAIVNGRQVIDMQIDKRVSDGIITIPRGLLPQDIAMLEKKFRVLGSKKKR